MYRLCSSACRDSWKWGTRCADNCCTEALLFGEESELDLAGTATLHPEFGLTTRVKYLDLPIGKRYISGTVYDPSTNNIIEGATCTLSGAGSGSMTSNGFGDFWFDKLGAGTYTVTVSSGSKTKTVTADATAKDVNLGDIALT
jgi:tetrathionate reductase subunit B